MAGRLIALGTVLTGVGLLASAGGCASRSPLSIGPTSDAAPPDTGQAQLCSSLDTTGVVDVDVQGGIVDHPALVSATNDGQVAALYHAWSKSTGDDRQLRVSTLEPWGDWPPHVTEPVLIDHVGGRTFAVGQAAFGQVALLLYHEYGASTQGGPGLFFENAMPPTAFFEAGPSLRVADPTATALAVVRGCDVPPVAINDEYIAALMLWDAIDPVSGAHGLAYAVSGNGAMAMFDVVKLGEELGAKTLACASAPIAADAVRVGRRWLIASGSGSPSSECATGSGPAENLAIERMDWPDSGDDVTSKRVATLHEPGEIVEVHAAPALGGAWFLVRRAGAEAKLVGLDADGKLVATYALGFGATTVKTAIAAVGDGVLTAHVDAPRTAHISIELRDSQGAVQLSTGLDPAGPVGALSVLASPAKDAVLLAWATTDDGTPGQMQLARVGCVEAP